EYLPGSLQGKISSDGCLKKEQMVVSAIASTPHLLVAMSLWHTHPLKGTLVSPETEMQQIRREVMLGWPADALNQATNRVLSLSGMLDNRSDADPEQTGKAGTTEPVTSKKRSKAS
ncbi:hypothetical protein NEL79_25155, partial [Escherichia coli]|nr:hypothetical protein [Escherichia coli]